MMIMALIGNEAKADRCSNFNKCPLHQYLIFLCFCSSSSSPSHSPQTFLVVLTEHFKLNIQFERYEVTHITLVILITFKHYF